jgi:hypothetical protein
MRTTLSACHAVCVPRPKAVGVAYVMIEATYSASRSPRQITCSFSPTGPMDMETRTAAEASLRAGSGAGA